MKLFWRVVIGMVILISLVGSLIRANSNAPMSDKAINNPLLQDNFKTETQKTCRSTFDKDICSEDTIIYCNGQSIKIPNSMTGYVIHDKVIVNKETNVNEKSEEKCEYNYGIEKPSPKDRLKDDGIRVYGSRVVIDVSNAKWRSFIDSNSMDPLIDKGTTTIEIKPESLGEIEIGDIITYDMEGYDYAFVHRVAEIGEDNEGAYFITKSDNLGAKNDYKLRFSQIKGIIVGILY